MMTNIATQQDVHSPTSRAVVHRTRGRRHGPITRMMSPGDLGHMLKPFVFLDLFESERIEGRGFAPHPHSGIATVTVFLDGSMTYADSTGKSGSLSAGAVEWMRAGAGVWHAGEPGQGEPMKGYQLWLALPPELELAPAESLYLEPRRIETAGPARVILGRYAGKTSAIPPTSSLNYLHVRLKDGERWTYQPAADHDIAWLALNSGRLHVAGSVLERELAVFAEGSGAIELVAEGAVEMVIASAAAHPHPLVTGYYSVHTTPDALVEGEANIAVLERSPAVAALRAR
jgi:redox-sensitive bicupin YhaK (pirin superfamily)